MEIGYFFLAIINIYLSNIKIKMNFNNNIGLYNIKIKMNI